MPLGLEPLGLDEDRAPHVVADTLQLLALDDLAHGTTVPPDPRGGPEDSHVVVVAPRPGPDRSRRRPVTTATTTLAATMSGAPVDVVDSASP